MKSKTDSRQLDISVRALPLKVGEEVFLPNGNDGVIVSIGELKSAGKVVAVAYKVKSKGQVLGNYWQSWQLRRVSRWKKAGLL